MFTSALQGDTTLLRAFQNVDSSGKICFAPEN